MRISYSALETFNQCPQKFKFQVIDNIRAPRSPEALFGTAVHGALKFMFSKDPVFPTLDEILANFSDAWKQSAAKLKDIASPEFTSQYDEGGRILIKKFYKENLPWNFTVIDTESRFEISLPDTESGEEHVLAGIIDRIDKTANGEYEIIDYKTNRKLPAQEMVDNNLQLSIYHMALAKKWPSLDPQKIRLSLYFLKHNEKLSSYRSRPSIANVKESVISTVRDIAKRTAENSFPAYTSPLCDYCPYKKICPAWKHLYKKESLPMPDDDALAGALKEYFQIKESEGAQETRLKELQSVIKAYMDANGVERVFDERGYYVTKKLQQRFKYDMDKVKAVLEGAGLGGQWEAILTADEKKLKTISSSLPFPVREKIAGLKILSKEFIVLSASTRPAKK